MGRPVSIMAYLGDGAVSRCGVYGDDAPILAVITDTAYLTLTAPDRHAVTTTDVAAAQELLAAVRQYAAEVEHAYNEQRARSDAEAVA